LKVLTDPGRTRVVFLELGAAGDEIEGNIMLIELDYMS